MCEEDEIHSRADLVPRLAALLHSDAIPTGERARLKRMGLRRPTPLAFHRLMQRHIPAEWQDPRSADKWKVLIAGLALQHGNPHDPIVRFGSAMAMINVSEMRVESLLSADGAVLQTLWLRMARRLAAQRKKCNWKDMAWLLFASNVDSRERTNDLIARDYFRELRQ